MGETGLRVIYVALRALLIQRITFGRNLFLISACARDTEVFREFPQFIQVLFFFFVSSPSSSSSSPSSSSSSSSSLLGWQYSPMRTLMGFPQSALFFYLSLQDVILHFVIFVCAHFPPSAFFLGGGGLSS